MQVRSVVYRHLRPAVGKQPFRVPRPCSHPEPLMPLDISWRRGHNVGAGRWIVCRPRGLAGQVVSIIIAHTVLTAPFAMAIIRLRLSQMDTINLKQITTNIKTVKITGEVFFPGVYPISDNQTLLELIKRAGGISEQGSAAAAFFQREEVYQK